MSVVALCGGIGGAKLALGLYTELAAGELTIIGNTGDDFTHLGLAISPDLDTVCYTLSGLADQTRGWGRGDESWNFMEAMRQLGGPDWFNLGDRDLALHALRTEALRQGQSLTEVTAGVVRQFGITATLLPMSDDPVRTMIATPGGWLAFQEYFVRERCAPPVVGVHYDGAAAARANTAALAALADPAVEAIVICPSNPVLSIDPILAVPGMRAALAKAPAPVVAVSPLIGGAAVKGPTAEIMREMGLGVGGSSVCAHYGDLLDGFVLDEADAQEHGKLPVPTAVTRTLMTTLDDRVSLARFTLDFASALRGAR